MAPRFASARLAGSFVIPFTKQKPYKQKRVELLLVMLPATARDRRRGKEKREGRETRSKADPAEVISVFLVFPPPDRGTSQKQVQAYNVT